MTGVVFFMNWEVSLIIWLQARMGAAGTALVSFFTMFGEQLISVPLLGFLYWCYDKEIGRFVGLHTLVGTTLNPMVKNLFLRRRPYFVHEEIRCLRPVDRSASVDDIAAQGFSFPSGHSTNAVLIFGSLARCVRKRWMTALGILIPLLCGLSRFCLGVHYPTDVLCGWLLGAAVLFLLPLLARKLREPRVLYAVILAAMLPGFFYCRSGDYFASYGILAGFLAGDLFERRFVHFACMRHPLRCLLRLAGGLSLCLALLMLTRLPFSQAFSASGRRAAMLVRTLRYGLSSFVCIGVYPMLFPFMDRLIPEKKKP